MSITIQTKLDFNKYQKEAIRTAGYPGQGEFIGLAYAALGANGEAGEVAEQVKKTWRDDYSDDGTFVLSDERREKILDEVGDTLWYLAAVCTEIDENLESAAERNIAKLADRMSRGVLGGDGSHR